MRLPVLLLCLVCCVQLSLATHWAYGTAVWKRTAGTFNTARTYQTNLTLAFRRDYPSFTPLPNAPPYGPTNGPYAPSGSYAALVCFYTCPATTCPGGSQDGNCLSISMVPRDIIPLGNWFTGRVTYTRANAATTTNTYWDYTNCCRLSTILDTNNDLNWRIRGVFNRYATDSPATTSVPRTYEDIGYLVKYSLLASHPQGRPIRFSMAPTGDSSLNRQIPSHPTYTCTSVSTVCIETSAAFSIHPTSGVVTWSPKTIGLYSVQFTITETDLYPGESAGTDAQRTTIPLDMIFEVTPVQPAPFFYAPFPLSVPPAQRIWTFYRGVEGQYPVCARSTATGAVIDINSVNLPTGATFTFLSRGTDAQGAYTCYLVKWAPRVDSVPTIACYLAVDTVNGYSSRGSYCILMDIGSAACIYVNGIIRDFHKVHADFALPKTGTPGPNYSLDSGLAMLTPILPADRKPQLLSAANPQSTRNQGIYPLQPANVVAGALGPSSTGEGYYDWWWTDTRALSDSQLRNKQRVETTILCNAGTPSPDIFRFLSSSYFPIDNQLFGNEGDPNNRYFTYEINTYLTFLPGHVYTFMSSDDLHVFIEGALPTNPGGTAPDLWKLSGIRANFTSAVNNVNMDQFKAVQNPTLVANETYRCDIFYCHRGRIGNPGLQIDLPDYKLCNGLTTGFTAFNFTSFNLGNRNNILLQGAAAWPASGTYIQLINSGAASQSGAAWYAVNNAAAKVKALYGFRTTFEFQFLTLTPGEGFAFVIQGGAGSPVPGTQGPNLGYGSLSRSIAIEFDSDLTTALGDTARTGTGWTGQFSEVSIHAQMTPDASGNYPGNSAQESASLGFSLNDPWMNFLNGSTHSIVVEYQTGQLDPSGAPAPSVIRVFMNKVISPVAQAIVDARQVSAMFAGGAVYCGFTASNSATKTATIAVNRWDMVVVPISPTKTAPVSPPGSPQNLIAGDNGVFLVQTKDECGNNILIGGEAANFAGTYFNPNCPGAPSFISSPIVDNNDGTYGLPYNPVKAWDYRFDVRFTNIPIFYNPFTFVVSPGPTDPPSCRIFFAEITAGYSATTLQDGMVVAVFTQYGKLRTGPLVYDFSNTPVRAGYTGGPTEFASFLTGTTPQTGDYIAIALNGEITLSATYASLPAVLSAMTSVGATLWPPSATQAYAFIGVKGSLKCCEQKPLGEANCTCRGSDNRSQSGARPFTISAGSLLTVCGYLAGGFGRVNSIFDTPRVPAGSLNTFSVMAVDAYGNLKTQLSDTFNALFVPDFTQDALPGGGTVVSGNDPGVTFDKGFYIYNMNSRRSNTYQLYIKQNNAVPTGGVQYGMTVIVVPGPAYLNTSSVVGGTQLTGNGVTTATAGQNATFYINLKDINGNEILSDEPINTITGQLIVKQTGLPPSPTIPLTLTWVNDTANNCAYCKLAATYYTTKATVPNSYEYQLQLTINGLTGIMSEPNVVAGPIHYPSCSHDCTNSTLGVLPAGQAATCTITTRDQWMNLRYVPNAPDPDFTATTNSVFFTQASAILSYTVTYPGAGQYRVTFTPRTKGSVLLNIQSNSGVQIGGSPSTLYIKAGIPAPPSILTIPAGPIIVAGTWYSFTMESRDPYNNVRDGGVSQIDDYILRFAGTIVDGQIRIAASSNHANTGIYTFEVRQTTPVGLYQVWVRTKFNEHVTNSPFSSITVIPDLTYPNNTIITGPGSTACIAGQNTYILLQARDEYTNLQTGDDDLALFTVRIRYPATTGPFTNGTISVAGPGLYYANYTCPALAGQPQYDIVLDHSGQPTHVPPYASYQWIFPGIILASTSISYARLIGVSDQRAGIVNAPAWTIRDCGNQICDTPPTACATSPCFRLDITNGAGQTIAQSDITVAYTSSPGGIPEYAVTFISPYVGTFTVRVYRNTIVETEESKAPGYSFVITAGYVDPIHSSVVGVPATISAGTSNAITVTLRDRFNNLISLTQGVVGIFTGGVAAPNSTCVQSGTVPSEYTCNYNLTLAGAWSIEIKSTGCANGVCSIQGLALSPDFPITVLALGPSCVTSSIQSAVSPITAGALVTAGREVAGRFNLLLQDVYGNTPDVNAAFVLSYTFSLNTPATMSKNFTAQLVLPLSAGGATYTVTYAPNIANPSGPNVLTAFIDGCALAAGPANVVVNPSDPAVPPSSIIRPGSPTVAGNPLSFTLQLQDRFGNAWFDAPQRVSATYRGNTPLTVTSVVGQPGVYTVTLPGASTTRAWEPNYDFVVAVDGNVLDFAGAERDYQVVAGPAAPLRTTFGPVAPQVVAAVVTYSLYTADQYGNPCRNSAGTDQIYFNFLEGAVPCNEELVVAEPPAAPGADYSITAGAQGGPFATHVGQGVYNITWSGFRTATYSFNVTVNGAQISCLNEPLQTIRPDVAFPANTHWFIETAAYPEVNAGQAFNIRVILRDQFGNPVETLGANDVMFGRSITIPPSPDVTAADPGWVNTPSLWMTAGDGNANFPTEVVPFEELRNSAYNFGVTCYTASPLGGRTPLVVFLRYQGTYWLIKGHVGTTTGAPVIDVRVKPGPAATFLPPTVVGTAGYPHNSFTLQAADLYGNIVDTTTHAYSITFVRTENNAEVVTYSVNPVAVPSTTVPGQHVVDFIPYWHGQYAVTIVMTLNDGTGATYNPGPQVVNITHATCNYEQPATNYRCNDRVCRATYGACTDLNGDNLATCGGTMVRCAIDNNCVTNAATCPCPVGTTRCGTGHCAPAAQCPSPPTASQCPSGFPHQCAGGYCRQSAADCPSAHVCTPGFLMCSDGLTCVRNAAECGTRAPCAAGLFQCPSGGCVREFADCPTPKTCANNKVVCPDGSCVTTRDLCPDVYECIAPGNATSVRCADGSCRLSLAECPTGVTCPNGYVLCENEACATSLSACATTTVCPLNRVRCPDGSCRHNFLFCPSQTTCPVGITVTTTTQVNGVPTQSTEIVDLPVKCADGSCKGSATACGVPPVCPYYRCSDGSCVQCVGTATVCPDRCPTPVTCSFDKPLLCLDGSCVSSLSDCSPPSQCPAEAPVRCPDGSCRTRLVDCPSRPVCPSTTPVLCPDSQCGAALDTCAPTELCPTGEIKCPGGFCADSFALCPTLVTCSPDANGVPTIKCLDGTCRATCDAANNQVPSCAPFLTCPQAGAGITCASRLEDCPQSFTCPPGYVRCLDSSCRTTATLCPAAPTVFTDSKVPCADGTWAGSWALCPTPTTCPPGSPYKCWDGSCRVAPADCPTASGCSAGLYQCPTGTCTATPWDQCSSTGSTCSPDAPVRCLADGTCRAFITDCPDPYTTGCATGQICSVCQGTLCSDGSCRIDPLTCPAPTCPTATPYQCSNGYCAESSTTCLGSNGCPSFASFRCPNDGSCVAASADCASSTLRCPPTQYTIAPGATLPSGFATWDLYYASLTFACDDGSCAQTAAQCYGSNGCPTASPNRCADGRCVDILTDCTSGSSGINYCPALTPYRCSDGFCAVSSTECPSPLVTQNCPPERPIACASGLCVLTASQCPLVIPCDPATEERCGDGSCRLIGHCPLASTCPTGSVRCFDGICSAFGCNIVNGCPAYQVRCDNGQCVNTTAECTSIPPNGCSIPGVATPYKCSDGECVANQTLCRLPNGCYPATPYKCATDGSCVADPATCQPSPPGCVPCVDGRCVVSQADCSALNNCPVETPIRCADGSCAKYPAGTPGTQSCTTTVVCGPGEYLCADGSCQSSSSLCAPQQSCPAGYTICSKDWLCHTAAECTAITSSQCPPSSPVSCPNGACKKSIEQCGFSGGGPSPPAGCQGVYCFDGSCQANVQACMNLQSAIVTPGASFPPTSSVNALCGAGFTLCWDGTCVEACWQCAPIPRCAKGQARCHDGTCNTEAACTAINNVMPPCDAGTVRCEDGMCRETCCAYDGCGFDAPYYCSNRECARRSQDCDNIARGRITYFTRRLLQASQNDPTTPCYDNCLAEIKAANQKVTVSINRATTITLAVDSSLTPIMRLTIPQGTLVPRTAGPTTTVLDLRSVGESRMRSAFNTVHPTRVGRGPYNFIQYLTFPQTVISPAFECNVDPSIREDFNVNMTVTSLVDNNRRSDDDVWVEDVCLAYLLEIGQYKNWVCLFSSQYDRRLLCPPPSAAPQCTKGRYIVRDPATAAPPENLVSSVIKRCTQSGATSGTVRRGTVYAFITSPLADYVPPRKKPDDIVESNIVPIILGIIFLILFGIFLIYLAVRLARYRKKYHEERAEADRLKEEVENMTQFGGEAGTKDDQVAMTKNPLAAQLEHLQQAVKEEDIKLQQAEQGLRSQEADIRKDHIDNMRSNRDKMLAELERLKQQLAESQASTAAPSTIEEPTGGYNAGYDGQASAGAGGYGQSDDGAYKAGFDQYQAPRGAPKKREL